ncbi:arylsulfatase G isoform X2 [Brachyhypopomus gauderio]|uniref:arylsulfatase G isoform X2 n=1 Tax=Brachyhypopomus gauderio TaxID=698409 RepID=UPI004042A6C7
MAEAGFGVLLLFCFLVSGLVYYIKNCPENGSKTKLGERPNIIVILADDIGWGDLWTKQSDSTTPWLNRLKLEGKRFTDFHSPASTCSPSRAALLTGRHGLRNGVTHNFAEGSVGGLPLNETTFAQLLHDSGYYTAMIGKWHLGHNGPYNPVHRGFDYYLGIPYSNDMGCTDRPGFNLPRCLPCAQGRDRGQPLLLYVALAHMHVPLFHYRFLDVNAKDAYSASLSDMDDLVGSIKLAAEAFSMDNTLIWFTGDNGPWEQKCQFAGSAGPFVGRWQTSRGGGSAKKTTWEGGHRVPTVVVWPGRISPNTSSSALLSGLDIFPTVLSIAGVKPPPDRRYDGIDITGILLQDSQELTGHKSLVHPNSGAAGQFGDLQTVRLGHHKAFYITGSAEACGGAKGKEQLHDPPLIFDLSSDVAEGSPLDPTSAKYQAVLREVEGEREAVLWDIATDNVSTADYSTTQAALPCCTPQNPVCRCHGVS